MLDLVDDNPVSRIPLSCYRSVANVRSDIQSNLQKYEAGNCQIVGANNFAQSNNKVSKAFANTQAPKVKQSTQQTTNSAFGMTTKPTESK